MVAEVRTRVRSAERLDGQHEMPVCTHGVEPLDRLLVERLAAVGPMIQEDAYGDPAGGHFFECGEEVVGRGIALQDVELDVHVLLRLPDGLGHRVERLLVAGDQDRAVVARDRHGAEVAVQAHERAEPVGRVRAEGAEVEAAAHLPDALVDDLLLAPALARQARVADEQEQQHADDRNEVDRQQPGHRRGGATVSRHEDDRQDAHGDIEHEDEDHPDECPAGLIHALSLPPTVCPAYRASVHAGSRPGFTRRVGRAQAARLRRPGDRILRAGGRAWRAPPLRSARRRGARSGPCAESIGARRRTAPAPRRWAAATRRRRPNTNPWLHRTEVIHRRRFGLHNRVFAAPTRPRERARSSACPLP